MIRILIVDDDPFIRESLRMILELDPELSVTAVYGNGAEAHEHFLRGEEADVVLMDIRMPVCSGVEGTKRIKGTAPNVRILILTTFDDDEYIVEALRSGASGYLLKNIPPDRIVQGIKAVHHGNLLIHPDIAPKLTAWLQPQQAAATRTEHECSNEAAERHASISDQAVEQQQRRDHFKKFEKFGLTKTEKLVLEHIAGGLTNKEIAQELFLSEGTVKNYVTELLSKLELRDRTQLAIMYWREL
ncbi:response regulator transcription factor [Paenibacillus sp. YYML68]|uniref:response regulator transcription factor n=1 Tax=Paenibacillus sp. YYML68 TaxID=2909250 RepID=UPI00249209D7|nr:response regulator transcription factor [Paenibacillus sp. YYML68]